MLSKNKKGSILIPLIIILFVALSILALSKFLATSQADVETAVGSRYQTSLSSKMDIPADWEKIENKKYKYTLSHPKQWVGALTESNKGDVVHYVERHLSNKVNLRLSIYNEYEIPQTIKPAKFDNNTFYLIKDEDNLKVAATKKDGLYYVIEFKQNTYFTDSTQFKGTLFHILKKFQFLEK